MINLEDLFYRVCINRHDVNVIYRHPDLYLLALAAKKRGELYFYTRKESNGRIVEAEPEYRWFANRDGLTDQEFEELKLSMSKEDNR